MQSTPYNKLFTLYGIMFLNKVDYKQNKHVIKTKQNVKIKNSITPDLRFLDI